MDASQLPSTPDARAFGADISEALFRQGEVDGKWQLRRFGWPHALIDVAAKVGFFTFRFELSQFPILPPTAQLWDAETDGPLAHDKWPRSRGGRVKDVFRVDWQQGTALYLACDRVTIQTHPQWVTQMPARLWRAGGSIVQYLEELHVLLNSEDFSPPLVPQSQAGM